MKKDPEYLKARARIHAQRGFYTHLVIYLIVNLILFLINLFQKKPHQWWFYWPLIGWGIGILVQAYHTFIPGGLFGDKWEEKKIREYMEKKGIGQKDTPPEKE